MSDNRVTANQIEQWAFPEPTPGYWSHKKEPGAIPTEWGPPVSLSVGVQKALPRPGDWHGSWDELQTEINRQRRELLDNSYAKQMSAMPALILAPAAGAIAEKHRIIAALNAIKPGETPYSRGSFEMIRKAEMRLWDRMMEAVVNPKPERKSDDHS